MSRLLSISELIRESWSAFATTWHKTLRITIWFLVLPAITFIAVAATRANIETSQALFTVLSLAKFIVLLWATVRLYRWLLTQEKHIPEPAQEARTAWKFVPSLLWTSILKGLAIIGGSLLFVFPGIWIAILLQFAEIYLIGENLHGTKALAASYQLVKGRWWATFWRLVIPGLLFLVLSILLVGIITNALGFIAGAAKMNIILTTTATSPLVSAAQQLIEGLTQAIFLPLFLIWQIKLFKSLQNSR